MPITENELAQKVIWAMGGSRAGELAHAYPTEEDFRNNRCLCSRRVIPQLRLKNWDLTQELVGTHTCPQCRKRLKFLAYLSEGTAEK